MEAHKQTQTHTQAVMEGWSALRTQEMSKRDRKRLWVAVTNKIDNTKNTQGRCGHFVASFSFFSNCESPFATVVISVEEFERARVKGSRLPCCAHICRGS